MISQFGMDSNPRKTNREGLEREDVKVSTLDQRPALGGPQCIMAHQEAPYFVGYEVVLIRT